MNRDISSIQNDLAKTIEEKTIGQEDGPTLIDGLSFFRREAITEPCPCTIEASVLFVVQGTKQLLVGEQGF
ncbi:MAG: AraC family transcriptional regulator N-terminal domain-containing protein, partial [Gilvibacter sp.]